MLSFIRNALLYMLCAVLSVSFLLTPVFAEESAMVPYEEEVLAEETSELPAEEPEPESSLLLEETQEPESSADEFQTLYDRPDGLVVFADTWYLMPDDAEEVSLLASAYKPSPKGSSNAIAGITINHEVRWTGMDAWWPSSNGLVTRDENWIRLYATEISQLKAGDVIEWRDDKKYGGLYTNHIAIVTRVARDGCSFVTADGNAGGVTGVQFITHTDLTKGNSSCGKVNIWRNRKKGGLIATSVSAYAQTIINSKDTSLSDYFWGRLGINWCYCFVIEALLQVNENGALYETPGLNVCKSTRDGIQVSWDSVAGAEAYHVYSKNEETGSWDRLAVTEQTGFCFTEAEPGKVYTFTVAARGVNGYSHKDKNGTSGVFLKGTKARAKKLNQTVKVYWKAVEKADGYIVYRLAGDGGWVKAGATDKTFFKDKAYVQGTENRYLVKPYIRDKGILYSGYINKETLTAQLSIPQEPSIRAVKSGHGAVEVFWKPVSTAEKYTVYRKSKGQKWTKIAQTKDTVYKDKTAQTGIRYFYSVSAANSQGIESDHNVHWKDGMVLPYARLKSATALTNGIQLKWKKKDGISGYYLYRRTGQGSFEKLAVLTRNQTSYLDLAGQGGQTCEYLLRAYKKYGSKRYFSGYDEKYALSAVFPGNSEKDELVIVLDPGHDKVHQGCSRGDWRESVMTMKIAKACKAELETYRNVKVLLTRKNDECPYPESADTGVDIMHRIQKAVRQKADVYVSLHINAAGGGQHGVMIIPQVPTWKPDLNKKGLEIGNCIKKELMKLGFGDNGVYYRYATNGEKYPDGSTADYYAVTYYGKYYDLPSLIMEHGYIDNDDYYLMNTDAKLKKMGVADAAGIAGYYGLSKK